ncbi:MAG: hypothetical protein ACIAXF_17560 [Phycisphaerales bacterium JB063]
MALEEVDLTIDETQPLPHDIARLLEDADQRIDRFMRSRQNDRPIASFVPCDFVMVYRALDAMLNLRAAPGEAFCEWGAGFGVVAGLAEKLGLSASGIEIHRDLVDQARELLDDHGVAAEIAHGSLIPDDGDELVDELSQQAWLRTGEASGYDELGVEVDDFDIIFAFPWPGDEALIDALFEKYAAVGALLLTYHGMNDIRLQRKTHD